MEFERGSGRYEIIQRRKSDLEEDVKGLQRQLAVLNLVMDKARTPWYR